MLIYDILLEKCFTNILEKQHTHIKTTSMYIVFRENKEMAITKSSHYYSIPARHMSKVLLRQTGFEITELLFTSQSLDC